MLMRQPASPHPYLKNGCNAYLQNLGVLSPKSPSYGAQPHTRCLLSSLSPIHRLVWKLQHCIFPNSPVTPIGVGYRLDLRIPRTS
jgi:hypothetical protein